MAPIEIRIAIRWWVAPIANRDHDRMVGGTIRDPMIVWWVALFEIRAAIKMLGGTDRDPASVSVNRAVISDGRFG